MKNWKWQEITIWLVAEIILNFSGYDNLADYTEFISAKSSASTIASRVCVISPRKV
jgi:hypothetical protein